jgi:predicted enzyme related to lactoylglutathione lyase
MSLHLANITFDCVDATAVVAFWSAALDLPVDPDAAPFFASLNRQHTAAGPSWFFIQVPEPKSAKNRTHVDLHADDREAEVQRLVGLGATRVAEKDEWGTRWTVMNDPEGNEFCVAGT